MKFAWDCPDWDVGTVKYIMDVTILILSNKSVYEGRYKKFSAWPSSVQNKIKIVLASYNSRLWTRHAQCDFWAINILCILVYEQSACQMVLRMLTPELCTSFWRTSRMIPTWLSKNLFHNLIFRMKRVSTTSILSQNNKAYNGTNESVKIVV